MITRFLARTRIKQYAGAISGAFALLVAGSVHGQFLPDPIPIESFESGVADWAPVTDGTNNVYLNHASSSIGTTNGAKSMLVDMYGTTQANAEDPRGGATGWAVTRTAGPGDTDLALYNAFNTVAANPAIWDLQFDMTLDGSSWADTTAQTTGPPAQRGAWSFLNLGFSTDAGFAQIAPVSPGVYGTQGKFRFRVPMQALEDADPNNTIWNPGAGFYQFLIGANNKFLPKPGTTVGPPPSGTAAKFYLDNFRFKPKAPVVPNTLFSWETGLEGWSDAGLNTPVTVDDPNTPDDERDPGDAYSQKLSIGTIGATAGAKSLTLDTTVQDPQYVNPLGIPQGYRFHWGSNMTLNADTDPGDAEVIDPAIKSQITNLVTKINKAQAIAFDVTFSDPLSTGEFATGTLPGFLGFALHISDERGTFFQADSTAFDGATISTLSTSDDLREPVTITLPISQFADKGQSALGPLSTAKLQPDTDFLRIGLAVNADGPAVIHIDNFRVLIETSLDADFDNDGDVDGADLPIWRAAYGKTDLGDANDDGVTNGDDFLIWQQQKGNDATPATPISGAVPEPTACLLLAIGAAFVAARGRRQVLAISRASM